ncbi:facilitated trehalose transporter Tret1-like [Belonocnema kinseyi]|uniref:facilitated trehalose transporter Tret1-like n=1 Tax=Belonocnema kinseyi TaxID=2817044 RepID=UPI00143D2D54|nr:facilitated trehalose transporter Tret1-like [Belonocnema kinseyi]
MVKDDKRHLLLQYTAAITTSITAIGFVCGYCWPSPALPFLTEKNSEFPVSKRQGSWIASLYPVGLIIGYLINPLFINRIGRKGTLMMYAIPQMASWLLIILAKNHINLYIARIIGGIGYGGGISASTVYVSEIGDIKNRGVFLVLMKFLMNFGFLFTMVLGAFLSYKSMNLVLLMIPFLFITIFFFMPDSSHFWEINQKKEEEVLMKLNPSRKEEMNLNKKDGSKPSNFRFKSCNLKDTVLWRLFAVSNSRRALEILSLMGMTNILSGHSGITTFLQQIFTYEGSFMSAEKATVVLTGSTAIVSLISTQFVEKIGRKVLLIVTGLAGSVSIGLVGIFFFLKEINVDLSLCEWVPLFGLTLFDVTLSCGLQNLFFIYQGELFPSDVKSGAIAFNKISYMSFSFFFLLIFQDFIDIVGIYQSFFIFSVGNLLGTFGIFILTPETKGKTLEEIQQLLKLRKTVLCDYNQ